MCTFQRYNMVHIINNGYLFVNDINIILVIIRTRMFEYITSGFTGSLYSYALVYWFGSFMVYLAAIGREEQIMRELRNIRYKLDNRDETNYTDMLREMKEDQETIMIMVKKINQYY
jgi:hypothetical protein